MKTKEQEIFDKYKWIIEDMGSPIQRAMWIVDLEKCIHEAWEIGDYYTAGFSLPINIMRPRPKYLVEPS